MFLIVGLGNPGSQYCMTRHNVGFQLADRLACHGNASFSPWPRWHGERALIKLAGETAIVLKPLTYMNLSGRSVLAASDELVLSPNDIVVLHDDLDLTPGSMKFTANRGPGGHNGIRSIIDSLGSRDFTRLRIGIGRPPEGQETSDYVLSNFAEEELPALDKMLLEAEKAVALIIAHGVASAMNFVNRSHP